MAGEGGAWLTAEVRAILGREILPRFLPGQRWFSGKARRIASARVADVTAPGPIGGGAVLAFVEVGFEDGGSDLYLLPLAAVEPGAVAEGASTLARLDMPAGTRFLVEATASDEICAAWLRLIGAGAEVATEAGRVRGLPTAAFGAARGGPEVPGPIRRGSAEQSNSAIVFGDRLILKLFRRLEPGENPDLEIGRFLTERARFDRVPTTAGAIVYEADGRPPTCLAILQGLVPNEGTGWEHALAGLDAFYGRVADRPAPPAIEGRSALEWGEAEPPEAVRAAIGPALDDAALLGRRTAELHRALASDPGDPAFAPEPLSAEDMGELVRAIRGQAAATFEALTTNLGRLDRGVAEGAKRVLDGAAGLLGGLDDLTIAAPDALKTRVHGDYHLGQVLRSGDDYVILDFEGEPAKPLEARRAKHSPIKDVVGMLRSFDYAAYAGLFARTGEDGAGFERLAPWARAWAGWTAAAFLRQYRSTAAGAGAWPADRAAAARMLKAYTLDKALYELLYELNNRPGWVRIPLQGVLDLLGRPGTSGGGG